MSDRYSDEVGHEEEGADMVGPLGSEEREEAGGLGLQANDSVGARLGPKRKTDRSEADTGQAGKTGGAGR